MFEVFGEFDSAEAINRAAAAQLEQGDVEAIKTICRENGIDEYNAEDFIDGTIPELCTKLEAAWGKLDVEAKELKLAEQELMKDWVDALRNMCVDYPGMAEAVRKTGKRLEDCIVNILKYSFKNQVEVPQALVKKAMPNFNQRVSLGVPCMKQVKKLIREYYLGEE